MTNSSMVDKINILIERGNVLLKKKKAYAYSFIVDGVLFKAWKSSCLSFLVEAFGPNTAFTNSFLVSANDYYVENVNEIIELFKIIKKDLEEGIIDTAAPQVNVIDNIILLLNKFHFVVRQLRDRHAERETIDVKDEYDLQDLLHSLLKIYFDDIRAEEWTPSYAGSSGRMDFLIKTEKIVIEVKMTRPNLKDKEIGNQLIEDIARYKEHSDCGELICFVYDPLGLIGNPRGLENDLSKSTELPVRVFIRP